MHLSQRRFILALLAIFVVALLVRVGMAARFVGLDSPPDFDANPDQLDYEWGAYQLVSGNGLVTESGQPTATRTPGTALSLAPAYLVVGRSFTAGRIWFCTLSAATCLVVAWIAWQVAGRGAALLAAVILAVYPGHAYYAMHFVSEVPYGLFLPLAVALTIHQYRHGGRWIAILAGACWTMAIYSRPQLLLLVPLSLLGILLALPVLLRYRAALCQQWLPILRLWAVQVAVVAVLLTPWFVRNAIVVGKPVMSTIAGQGMWGSHNPLTFADPTYRGDWVRMSDLEAQFGALPEGEVARDAEASRRGRAAALSHWDQMPTLVMYKLGRFLSPFLATTNATVRIAFAAAWLAIAPLVVVGAWQGWRTSRAATIVLLAPMLATLVTVILFYGSIRFRDSIAPLLVTLAAVGLMSLARLAKSRLARSAAAAGPQDSGQNALLPPIRA